MMDGPDKETPPCFLVLSYVVLYTKWQLIPNKYYKQLTQILDK